MSVYWWALMVVLFSVAVFVSACGKTVPGASLCTLEFEPTVTKSFGTLEHMACDAGQVLLAVDPKWLPGGIITHVEVTCSKVRVKCE